jgi:hypothetical protein
MLHLPTNSSAASLGLLTRSIVAAQWHAGVALSAKADAGLKPADIDGIPMPGAKISVCHGVGGMFAASGTIIMSNEPP